MKQRQAPSRKLSPPPRHWRKQVLKQIRFSVPRCIVQDGWWLEGRTSPP